jgi:UDP-N-acetyl-D-galactosamine dehydrogenase
MTDKASRRDTIAVIGLGYVGLPLAVELSRFSDVIGYDLAEARVRELNIGHDRTGEQSESDLLLFLENGSAFSSVADDIADANVYIVTVPTPVNEANEPDFNPLISASKMIGSSLQKGELVIYESTVFPGATEEICVPILESFSGLRFCKDFSVGYSPERINPGDNEKRIIDIVKITSGCCGKGLDSVDAIYAKIIDAGTYRAPSIMVAEASKVIENTQRDINIAFMNELSIVFDRLGINTNEVLEAASTKWNFLKFSPGLVGGHCISVDPHYLQSRARSSGGEMKLVKHARQINESIPRHIVKKIVGDPSIVQGAKVLIKGVTFKENCADLRNSKVVDLYRALEREGFRVDVCDPWADSAELFREYDIRKVEAIENQYDVIILAVAHREYIDISAETHKADLKKGGLFFDLKGVFDKNEVDFQL